jgi:hypothetical protein
VGMYVLASQAPHPVSYSHLKRKRKMVQGQWEEARSCKDGGKN